MKLIELIGHLKNIRNAEEIISALVPDIEFDLIDIYLKDTISIDSDLKFFNAEEIPNNLQIEIGGIKYFNLFPLNLVQEMIEQYVITFNGTLSSNEIAKKLLEYRIKDA